MQLAFVMTLKCYGAICYYYYYYDYYYYYCYYSCYYYIHSEADSAMLFDRLRKCKKIRKMVKVF